MGIVQVYLGRDIEAEAADAAAERGLSLAKWAAGVIRDSLGAGAPAGPGRPEVTTGAILERLGQGPAALHELVDHCGKRAATVLEKLTPLIGVGKVIRQEKRTLDGGPTGKGLRVTIRYGLPGAFDRSKTVDPATNP